MVNVQLIHGRIEEALAILRNELFPGFEHIGDQQSSAVTMGKIAHVLAARGELDEALRIRREEQLPVYERLGATRDLLVCQTNTAIVLLRRKKPGDREAAAELLRQAYATAVKMAIPEADQIRRILKREGFSF